MRWLTSRPPPKSRQSSPTKLSTACLTGSVETTSECDSSDPAAEVLMVNGPRSPPGFPRVDGGDGGGDSSRAHEEYRPEPLCSQQREELRRRDMDALHTPIVGETPRPGPWRRRAWPTWLSALDWRTCSTHSTSVLGSVFLSPVDDNFFRLQLRYTELRSRISQLLPE